MTERLLSRRDFVGGSAMAGGALLAAKVPMAMAAGVPWPHLPEDLGPCPIDLASQLQYIVQRRAAEGLNRINRGLIDPSSQQPGHEIKAGRNECFIAWSAALAYRNKWSRFYHSEDLRYMALMTLDAVARTRADGDWEDGGLNRFFGLQAFALAVLSWQETGTVDRGRMRIWVEAAVKTADQAMIGMLYGPYRISAETGQYANPEFYYLAGLAAMWKLTGWQRYRDEASNALRRYDEWLFRGGGVAYFFQSSPCHNYQQLVAQGVSIYWDLTQDPYALDFIKRMVPYYPNIQHSSGVVTDAELPVLKHNFSYIVTPAIPAMIACITSDGENRYEADIATKRFAESMDNKKAFDAMGIHAQDLEIASYAATALRLMERSPLPASIVPSPRRVFMDESFRGVRSQWDDFMAASTTRQMSDSLAGAYIADVHEPISRLNSAMDGVYFEVITGKKTSSDPTSSAGRTVYGCTDWSPIINYAASEGFASSSCVTALYSQYWGDLPNLSKDNPSHWQSAQHWAVWQDYLVGFGALQSTAAGGDDANGDIARVRWRLSPANRKLTTLEQTEHLLRFQYGRLKVDLACLDQRGGCAFKSESITESPRAAWTPMLVRPAPWSNGDGMHVSTVIRPDTATGVVQTKALPNGAGAIFRDQGGQMAHVWAANLTRSTQHYLLDIPDGVKVQMYKRDVVMPPIPKGQPGHAGLLGGESAVWVIESDRALDAGSIFAGLREGKNGR